MPTQLQLVNRAITEIARDKPLTTGNVANSFGGSSNGVAAAILYTGAVQLLLRQQDWEFSRRSAALVAQPGTPPLKWTQQYLYPSDCLKIRQVVPATWDQYDPQPVRWDEGTIDIVGTQTRVIWTNEASATMIYTTSLTTEDEWDSGFQEHFVRYLGSMLALPVAGRPDFSREMLKIAGGIGQASMDRDS